MSEMRVVTRQTFAEIPYVDRVPDLRNLKPQPVNWTVNRLIPAQSFTIMAGGPGAYKSWIALDMAFAIATGGSLRISGQQAPGRFSTLIARMPPTRWRTACIRWASSTPQRSGGSAIGVYGHL